ncbi:MAG: DUF3795 domain-containing protein [Desulfobaccales bacterium]
MMSEMIAYCGKVCSICPTFLATKDNDDVARAKTAALYAEKFGLDLQPEDINCDGCRTRGGKQIGYCGVCEIRRCCMAKDLENCACCEQPCENLLKFHELSPDAKATFEALKTRQQ